MDRFSWNSPRRLDSVAPVIKKSSPPQSEGSLVLCPSLWDAT